jgi:DNA sulfur modification protein DndD
MILEQLTLRDFCLFAGTQVFNLTPVRRGGKHLPIILFGGINGGGKTTLLDAIQLALYGPRARCSKRFNLSYEDFLKQSVHHGVPPEDGAAVALTFRHAADGEEQQYEVRRLWHVRDGRLREELRVLKNGLTDDWLSDNWPQLVEDPIPLEISQLFFFDAEKIRSLAEDESSSRALGSAVKALLGLDIVERLITDTAVLQTRLARETGPPEQQAQVGALDEQVRAGQTHLEALVTERAGLENRLQRAAEEARQAEGEFAAAGGKHWRDRDAHQKHLKELNSRAREIETQLLALAGGELPLLLVNDLLTAVAEQDRLEREVAEAEIVLGLLRRRDEQLLELVREARTPAQLVQKITEFLDADRLARQPPADVDMRFNLSEDGRSLLSHYREHRLREVGGEARRLVEMLDRISQERDDLERTLAVTPDDQEIARQVERLKSATQNRTLLDEQAKRLDADIAARKAELQQLQARLRQLWEGRIGEEIEREDKRRLVQLAGRTRDTMQEFLRRATARKIDRLSEQATESFRFLARKQTLAVRVVIDPATFAITLYDEAGRALAKQRLSEGEKQIFAVAVLWGLARAAARPLPAIIDTPMARLDAAHRRNLIERYFPNASRQVVIFSTDTEVDRQAYQALQPAIARAYHLNYDERRKVTVGEEGYFWKED